MKLAWSKQSQEKLRKLYVDLFGGHVAGDFTFVTNFEKQSGRKLKDREFLMIQKAATPFHSLFSSLDSDVLLSDQLNDIELGVIIGRLDSLIEFIFSLIDSRELQAIPELTLYLKKIENELLDILRKIDSEDMLGLNRE